MPKKTFSAEELEKLRSSPYVYNVISGMIKFTEEFKHIAYEQLVRGIGMREIFETHGIDPKILGASRIRGFAMHLRSNAARESGFEDLRQYNTRRPPKETEEQILAARVDRLEHELAYTRQEVEFLKKIHLADLEARKQWESKQRRK
ncbi:MAG: hypothetical protein K6B54_07910 [Clostridia bacterium]|nr:hypothetical protein [Clostridia bacterium]